MSAATLQQEPQERRQPQENRGRFKAGFDSRRHRFTRDECIDGFWAAIESIVCRYPDAIMPDGRHMVVNFLATRRARPKRETIN